MNPSDPLVEKGSQAGAGESATAEAASQELVVPVLREEAALSTRQVETGRVRISKSVDEREEVVSGTLCHDEVDVRRVAVNEVIDPRAMPVTREVDGVLIVPVLEEVLVVEKRLLLKEELHVERRHRQSEHRERVVLRSEKVKVERDRDGRSEDQA